MIKNVFKSILHAIDGILYSFRGRNMQIHILATICVTLFSFILQISQVEWSIILICIGVVWSAEIINTSIEEVCDILRDNLGQSWESTKKARDLAAGAVLVLAFVSAIIGSIILIPKIIIIYV